MTSEDFPRDTPRGRAAEPYDEDFDTGPARPFEDPPDEDDLWPGALDRDPEPLPGVKADDPKTGAEDPERSDDEVAEELESDPSVDSGDGVTPEPGEDRVSDGADEVGETAFTPFHPKRPGN